MKQQHNSYWKPINKIPSLKQACQKAIQHGAYYIYFAGNGQPLVLIPIQTWRELQDKTKQT